MGIVFCSSWKFTRTYFFLFSFFRSKFSMKSLNENMGFLYKIKNITIINLLLKKYKEIIINNFLCIEMFCEFLIEPHVAKAICFKNSKNQMAL